MTDTNTETETAKVGLPTRIMRFLDTFVPEEVKQGPTEMLRRGRTMLAFAAAAVILAGIMTIVNVAQGSYPVAIAQGVAAIIALFLPELYKRTANLDLIGIIGLSLFHVALVMPTLWESGISGGAIVFLPLIPAIAMLALDARHAFAWVIILAVTYFGILAMNLGGTLPMIQFVGMESATIKTLLPPKDLTILKTVDMVMVTGFLYVIAKVFDGVKNEALAMVEERNRQVQRANDNLRQLFDNMRQGVMAFGRELTVSDRYSAQAKLIFHRDELSGERIDELLFGDEGDWDPDKQAFSEWLSIAFTVPGDAWDTVEQLAPQERVIAAGTEQERHLALDFRPIIENGQLVNIMALVTDQTERVRLEREAKEQAEAHERELAAMQRRLSAGVQVFIKFLEDSEMRLENIRKAVVEGPRAINGETVELLFRYAHTVKGDARAFELMELERDCHHVEEILNGLRAACKEHGEAQLDPLVEEVTGHLERANAHLVEAREQLIEASPVGAAVLGQTTVQRNDIQELVAIVERVAPHLNGEAKALRAVATRLASRPFGEGIGRLVDGVERWAAELDKRAMLTIEGKDILISPELANALNASLTHMVRNSIAHGIEDPDFRFEHGKDQVGQLRVSCIQGSQGPTIVVEDDGGGINTDRLREKALALGVPFTPGKEADLIWASGMSTNDNADDISGRGVGMSAVQAEMEAVNYEIITETVRGKGTRFIMRHRSATRMTMLPPALSENSPTS
jgi:hypothetical protein